MCELRFTLLQRSQIDPFNCPEFSRLRGIFVAAYKAENIYLMDCALVYKVKRERKVREEEVDEEEEEDEEEGARDQ